MVGPGELMVGPGPSRPGTGYATDYMYMTHVATIAIART